MTADAAARLCAIGARVDLLVMPMRLAIDAEGTDDSHLVTGRQATWLPLFYRLDEPRDIAPGETVTIEALRRTAAIHMRVKEAPVDQAGK